METEPGRSLNVRCSQSLLPVCKLGQPICNLFLTHMLVTPY